MFALTPAGMPETTQKFATVLETVPALLVTAPPLAITPIFQVVKSAEQVGAELIESVGAFRTTTLMLFVVAHCPELGVNK
jgi:hypothetical protein